MTGNVERSDRRWIPLLVVVVAMALTGAVIYGLTKTDSPPLHGEMGSESTMAASVESEIAWSAQELTVAGFTTIGLLGSDGAFYALSTSPDVRQIPADGSPPDLSVYRSLDGITWSETPIDGMGDDLWLRNFSEADGELYVAGTAPSVADPSRAAVRVGWSGDMGASWDSTAIELEAVAPFGMGDVLWSATNVSMAATSSFLLVAASSHFYVDYNSLVPPGVLTESSAVQRSATGLEVVDFSAINRCRDPVCMRQAPIVVWSSTWAELGVDPEPEAMVETFLAQVGDLAFRSVSTPFSIDQEVGGVFAAGDQVFVLARPAFQSASAPQGQPLRAWRTPNGSDWEPVAGFPAMDSLLAYGPLGEGISVEGPAPFRLGVIGQIGMEPVVGISDDGGQSWRSVDLSALLPTLGQTGSRWITAAGIGPMGAFVNVSSWLQAPDQPQAFPPGPSDEGHEVIQFLESGDLLSWSSTPSAQLISGGVSQILVGEEAVLLTGFQRAAGAIALLGTREG